MSLVRVPDLFRGVSSTAAIPIRVASEAQRTENGTRLPPSSWRSPLVIGLQIRATPAWLPEEVLSPYPCRLGRYQPFTGQTAC